MRRFALAALVSLICASALACKDGSGSTEDAGIDASLDGGAGGTAGIGGAGGSAGFGGVGGAGGAGGAICELTVCPTGCVDLDSDEQNCGACGNVCEETDVCNVGTCMPG